MDAITHHAAPRTSRAVPAAVGALTLVTGLLAGCGGQGEGDGGAARPAADAGYGAPAQAPASAATGGPSEVEELVIVIEGFDYTFPAAVPAGAEIVVRNLDGVGHTVTADEGDTFDVVVGPGEETTFTAPSEPGEHPFHCTPHPAMTGTLVVEGDGS